MRYGFTDIAGTYHSAITQDDMSQEQLQSVVEQHMNYVNNQAPATHGDMMMVADILREILAELRKPAVL